MTNCKPGLPSERTDWIELQPLVSAAIEKFIAFEDTSKLLKMNGSERTLVSNLKVQLEKEFARKYGDDLWSVHNDHNRVLEFGTPKKQPTDYVLDAIELFRYLRDTNGSAFGRYLKQFAADDYGECTDDFYSACGSIIDSSRSVLGDIEKNITTPDLIIHEMGCLARIEHNLIVFEIKLNWAIPKFKILVDLARLSAFTKTKLAPDQHLTPTYQYGIFLCLSKNGFDYGWRFENGCELPVEFKLG